jgi:hypothetical protein
MCPIRECGDMCSTRDSGDMYSLRVPLLPSMSP